MRFNLTLREMTQCEKAGWGEKKVYLFIFDTPFGLCLMADIKYIFYNGIQFFFGYDRSVYIEMAFY